jgi:5-methyltetrahydropteroyltriglutamate--homocysteine methyltransferase
MDLEAAGMRSILIDEAAFREKLPLRKEDWNDYYDWVIRAFRLTHASVQPESHAYVL